MKSTMCGTMLILGCLSIAEGASGKGAIGLTVLPSTIRVRPEDVAQGADSVDIAAAGGEYESFQVVVTARGGGSGARVPTRTE